MTINTIKRVQILAADGSPAKVGDSGRFVRYTYSVDGEDRKFEVTKATKTHVWIRTIGEVIRCNVEHTQDGTWLAYNLYRFGDTNFVIHSPEELVKFITS